MKIKTNELTGPALDWAVAKCWYSDRRVELTEGKTGVRVLRDPTYDGNEHHHWFVFFGSEYWDQGGPIIERELLDVCPYDPNGKGWRCTKRDPDYTKAPDRCHSAEWGPTPLVAAMRCFVASKLGDEVDVPNELLTKSDIIRALHPDAAELKITPADPADFTGFPTLTP